MQINKKTFVFCKSFVFKDKLKILIQEKKFNSLTKEKIKKIVFEQNFYLLPVTEQCIGSYFSYLLFQYMEEETLQ